MPPAEAESVLARLAIRYTRRLPAMRPDTWADDKPRARLGQSAEPRPPAHMPDGHTPD